MIASVSRRALPIVVLFVAAGAGGGSTSWAEDRLGRAVRLHDEGRTSEARRLLDEIVREEPVNHRALWNRGLAAMEDGEPVVAIDWFDRAIALDGAVADYHLWRGYALVRRAEDAGPIRRLFAAPKVRRAFERAVELDGSNVEARRALMRFYERAPAILGGGKAKAAEQEREIRRLSETGDAEPDDPQKASFLE